MTLYRDVVNIVIKYLEPKCLRNFWIDEGLDWEMRFVYDGSNFPLYWDEINVCFGEFDGIMLVGIGLYNNIYYDIVNNINYDIVNNIYYDIVINNDNDNDNIIKRVKQLKVNLNKIKYCGLYENPHFAQKRDDSCSNLSLLNYLVDAVSVIKLKIVDFYMSNMGILHKFVDLKRLIIEKRVGNRSTFVRGIYKCENLRYLKIVNLMLDCSDFNNISKCRNLVSFDWSGKSSGDCMLECNGLRKFRLVNNDSEDLSIISGCTGLRNVSIKNCVRMNNMLALKSCKELRNVVISGCSLLKGWDFGEHVGVKYVD